MRRKRIPLHTELALCFWLVATMLVACAPATAPPPPTIVAGWCAGGPGVFTPEDARCYLDQADPTQVQTIDEETTVLFAGLPALTHWPGAAIIYHHPTVSTLVLDSFGDVIPQASRFSSRAGLAALAEVAGDTMLMADLKEQIQEKWQTVPAGEPEVRLGAAWQDGPTTIFLIVVAGLEAGDDRFYCPEEMWTIGDETIEIIAECSEREPGAPVSHILFETQTIGGNRERPVQVALHGVPSNVVQVRAGAAAWETLVYRAVLEHLTNRPLIIRNETAPGLDDLPNELEATVDPSLLHNYLAVNETPHSLRFLFHNSRTYILQPGAVITRDYLPAVEPRQACAHFRRDYPALGGVVTVSRIGVGDDGAQALVHALHECGPGNRLAAYFILAATNDGWQVTHTMAAATGLPTLSPQMDYASRANGCGDIFVYRANRTRSEFVTVSLDASALALSTTLVMLDLAENAATVGVAIDVYAGSVDKLGEYPYCNDAGPMAVPQSVWHAVGGTVTITLSTSPPAAPCSGERYRATVLLEDVVFALGEETVHLPSLAFDDVSVGWCPG